MTAFDAPCPSCGLRPGPYQVLHGWQPCCCGGHRTRSCQRDFGGCGHVTYEPELVEGRCVEPSFGFSGLQRY